MKIDKFDLTRFDMYVRKQSNGCWLWDGGISGNGDPAMHLNGKSVHAHRFAYEAYREPIPAGMYVIRTCDTPGCVNPEHLRMVTMSELLKERGNGNAGRAECVHGHPFNEENTRLTNGRRICRQCESERKRHKRQLTMRTRDAILAARELDMVG